MNDFAKKIAQNGMQLRHTKTEILQINVGKLCNLTCVHCHVNAGPKRKEIMTRATIDRIIDWLAKTDLPTVDLTGGAPEMIPDFRYFVRRLKQLTPARHIMPDQMVGPTILLLGWNCFKDHADAERVANAASDPITKSRLDTYVFKKRGAEIAPPAIGKPSRCAR